MKLLFEYPDHNKSLSILPELDTPEAAVPEHLLRKTELRLPNISENELSRHFTELESQTFGVNDGFYPLGSCTMKYNPKINDEMANLPGFTDIHPLQPVSTVQGALEMMHTLESSLCGITGMDDMTLQPAAGAHGEFTGILLIRAYHEKNGDTGRTEIIVPVSAHGTNPATASMAGFKAVNVPVRDDGCVDIDELKKLVGPKTAGLMLTNPNTVGLFEKDILEIADLVHKAGGLLYYDGANLNPIMGIVRPGDTGFDVVHLNLHKTFSTPHGGGGPGSGPVGCKKLLSEFLPVPKVVLKDGKYDFDFGGEYSIGKVRSFYGNFLVAVRALTYILTLGAEGIREAAQGAVINANYMRKSLEDLYDMAYPGVCMHEFVMTMERQKKEKGASAMDFAKTMLDYRMHPPTMYFPLCVKEALMVEPTETESKESLDEAIAAYRKIYEEVMADPGHAAIAPHKTPITRVDEVGAARNPRLRFEF